MTNQQLDIGIEQGFFQFLLQMVLMGILEQVIAWMQKCFKS